jgi:hypothetical protein
MIGFLYVAVVRIERVIGSQVWPWFVVLGLLLGCARAAEEAEGKGLWGTLTGICPFSLKPKIEIP